MEESSSSTIHASTNEWYELMGKNVLRQYIDKKSEDIPTAVMGTIVVANVSVYFLQNTDDNKNNTIVKNEADENNIITDCDLVESKCAHHAIEVSTAQRYQIGEADGCPAVELALRASREGEKFKIRASSRYCYGYQGRPEIKSAINMIEAIPPNQDLEFEITILQHVSTDKIDAGLIPSEQIEEWGKSVSQDDVNRRLATLTGILLRKEVGNRWFTYGDFGRAARSYAKGTKLADNFFQEVDAIRESEKEKEENVVSEGTLIELSDEAKERQKKAEEIRKIEKDYEKKEKGYLVAKEDQIVLSAFIACLNNLAACNISQGNNAKAKELCVKVLELDPNNMKALMRAGKAALAMHEYEETDACIKTALSIESGNKTALALDEKLQKARKAYKARSKEMANKMANKLFNKSDAKPSESESKSSQSADLCPPKPSETPRSPQKVKNTPQVVTPPPQDYNIFLLLTTSAFVVIASIVVMIAVQYKYI